MSDYVFQSTTNRCRFWCCIGHRSHSDESDDMVETWSKENWVGGHVTEGSGLLRCNLESQVCAECGVRSTQTLEQNNNAVKRGLATDLMPGIMRCL